MLRFKNVGLYLGLKETHMILKRDIHRKNSFYDALGLTPKASQSDIKKAFYKLSMKFHPDKSTGNDSKFKEISAAYEVLGNLKLRRMYDRGLLPSGVSNVEDVDISVEKRQPDFTQGRTYTEEKQKPFTGRTNTYNFDEWTRAHYSENFTRPDNTSKHRWMRMRSRKVITETEARTETLIWMLGCVILSCLFYSSSIYINDWDKPRKRNDEN